MPSRGQFFRCDCGSHGIYVEKWGDEDCIDISFMYHKDSPPPLCWRIKQAWKFLRTGHLALDDIVLRDGEANALGRWLLYLSEKKVSEAVRGSNK